MADVSSPVSARAVVSDRAGLAQTLKQSALTQHLEQSPVWSALLHTEQGQANIKDLDFLLSLPNFSPAAELQRTIDFLYQGEVTNVCRFPARYLWLQQQLHAPELSLDVCPDIVEFTRKAPLDDIALVFASENIAQPASMLGHAFLKFSGSNAEHRQVSHAISFFTDADSINLPKLLFDSMVIGKTGYFSLSPFSEQQHHYVDEDQRNIWEYHLHLDADQKELIRLHLLELKQSHLTYFFQKYNCATVIKFILSLSGQRLPDSGWWVTPRSLVKSTVQAGLVDGTSITSPSRWIVHKLAEQTSVSDQQAIRSQVLQGDMDAYLTLPASEPAFIQLELARAYNQYAYAEGKLDEATRQANEDILNRAQQANFADKVLDVDARFDPLNTPGENQISVAARHDGSGNLLALTVLPISHTLIDDNRGYSIESSLQLFATTINYSLTDNRASLERLIIYDMQSLMPYDMLTGGLSGHFHIAIEPRLNPQFELARTFTASGAIGIAKRYAQDLDLYVMGGGGVGISKAQTAPFITLETGAVVREVWDMKSLISTTFTNNLTGTDLHYFTLGWTQTKYLDQSNSLSVAFKRDFNGNQSQYSVELAYKRIF